MIKNHRVFESGTKKFADRYVGPFYVLDILSDVNFRVARTAEDKPQIIHHDRMKKIDRREDSDIEWVFKRSRTLQRQKAKEANCSETMIEVMDRLTKLESRNQQAKRKYNRREPPPNQLEPHQRPQEVEKKRGRPRRPKPKPVKREKKKQYAIELNLQGEREKQEKLAEAKAKPKIDKSKHREGERRSARRREKQRKD